jgi:hypothetical protein
MHIIGQFCWIFAAWRWGDWKNWRRYHETMLYMIAFSLLCEVLTYQHSFWMFEDFFLRTHTLNSLAVTFVGFPCSVLIFLSHFPGGTRVKQLIYIALWIALYVAIEYFFVFIDLFEYDNGWSLGWSVLFDAVMFPMLALHHRNPLLAYFLSVLIIIFYLSIFPIPLSKIK